LTFGARYFLSESDIMLYYTQLLAMGLALFDFLVYALNYPRVLMCLLRVIQVWLLLEHDHLFPPVLTNFVNNEVQVANYTPSQSVYSYLSPVTTVYSYVFPVAPEKQPSFNIKGVVLFVLQLILFISSNPLRCDLLVESLAFLLGLPSFVFGLMPFNVAELFAKDLKNVLADLPKTKTTETIVPTET